MNFKILYTLLMVIMVGTACSKDMPQKPEVAKTEESKDQNDKIEEKSEETTEGDNQNNSSDEKKEDKGDDASDKKEDNNKEGNKDGADGNNGSKDGTDNPKDDNNGNKENDKRTRQELYMGLSGYAEWKVSEKVYYNQILLEQLMDNPKNIDMENLKKMLRINSSEPQGINFYTFTDNDMKEMTIDDLHYDGMTISFFTTYKGLKSEIRTKLTFDKYKYLDYRIGVNHDFVKQHYIGGVAENTENFLGNILVFDWDKYHAELVGNSVYKT